MGGVGVRITDELSQRFGAGEREQATGAGVRVEAVGEPRLNAGRLEHEGQSAIMGECLEADLGAQAVSVSGRLPLDAGQGGADGLGLDDANHALVDVEQVVGATVTGSHDGLAHSHPCPREEVEGPGVLNRPAGFGEMSVDDDPSPLLGGEAFGGGRARTLPSHCLGQRPRIAFAIRKYTIRPAASTNVEMNGLENTAGSAFTALASSGMVPPTEAARQHMVNRVSPITEPSAQL